MKESSEYYGIDQPFPRGWTCGHCGWTKKPVPSTPNSTSHEERYFWGWRGIIAGLLLAAPSVYRFYLS